MSTASLALDLAHALDPACWAAAVSGLTLDPWQAAALRSTAPRQAWNVCRQGGGKSTTAALLGLHTAVYQPGSLILLLSPSQRQSQELATTLFAYHRALGAPVPAEAESALRLKLVNGSRIIALPGSERTVRGYAGVALLIVDECARVDEALWAAVAPMVGVSGGRIVLLSTPFGKQGLFYRLWTEGGAGWERTEIAAPACPRLSPAFLAEMRASLPAWQYRQEFECAWEESEDAVFGHDDIAAAFDARLEPVVYGFPLPPR